MNVELEGLSPWILKLGVESNPKLLNVSLEHFKFYFTRFERVRLSPFGMKRAGRPRSLVGIVKLKTF